MKKYRMITHIHTRYSRDSLLPFFLLYRKCRKRKIDYIAITEHNNITGAVQFKKYCKLKGSALNVIIGEEIMTNEGEIIGLFLNKNILPMQSPEDTVAEIRRQGGIVYVPHPYDEKRYKTVLTEDAIDRLSNSIDCIECHNGRNISKEYDKKQNAIANKYNLKKIIGSDAHTIFEVGDNYMETYIEPSNSENFLVALDNMAFYPHKCKKYTHQLTKIVRVIKLLKQGEIVEICKLIFRKLK